MKTNKTTGITRMGIIETYADDQGCAGHGLFKVAGFDHFEGRPDLSGPNRMIVDPSFAPIIGWLALYWRGGKYHLGRIKPKEKNSPHPVLGPGFVGVITGWYREPLN